MTMRDVRVTRRTPMPKLRPMHDYVPFTAIESRPSREDRATRHTEIIRDGFVTEVRPGRGDQSVTECRVATSAPNMDDRRAPTKIDSRGRYVTTGTDAPSGPSRRIKINSATGARTVVDDNENGGQSSPRMVRLVSDGDARLPGVRMKAPKAPRHKSARTTGEKSDRMADVRAFAAAHGIPAEKLADRRVVAAIRDVIAHRAGIAAYAAR